MAVTTITLPNGITVETTAVLDIAALMAPITPQPKADLAIGVEALGLTALAEMGHPKPKASRTPRTPKVAAAQTPKVDGKALWATITSLVAEGRFDEARKVASVKPDTFGVQCEASIGRHQAKGPKAPTQPKAERHPVLDTVIPEPPKAERRAAKRAAKAATAAREAKPRNHKPDCGCVTCPNGVAARKAKAAPKVTKVPTKVPTARAPKVLDIAKPITATAKPKAVDAEKVATDAYMATCDLMAAMDVDGLKAAARSYLAMANRADRLNNGLYEAYVAAADEATAALAMVTA